MSEQPKPSVSGFFAGAPHLPHGGVSGNTKAGALIADELRRVARQAAERAPRSVQRHLGPSELGTSCDRQVVGKLVGAPATNHLTDPWPSIVGTAFHAWIADVIVARAAETGEGWLAEQRVNPYPPPPGVDPAGWPDYSGTADLYRAEWEAVLDHKALGTTTHAKLKLHGPGRHYLVQLLLYARGYQLLGFPVRRVGIVAWPRTGSSLDGLYVWERELDADTERLVEEVLTVEMPRREKYAEGVRSGAITIDAVPRTPDTSECYFCPQYRPQSGHDGGSGCPGAVGSTKTS